MGTWTIFFYFGHCSGLSSRKLVGDYRQRNCPRTRSIGIQDSLSSWDSQSCYHYRTALSFAWFHPTHTQRKTFWTNTLIPFLNLATNIPSFIPIITAFRTLNYSIPTNNVKLIFWGCCTSGLAYKSKKSPFYKALVKPKNI